MRTSLNEIRQIEAYLLQTGQPEDNLLVEAKLSLSSEFSEKVESQKSAYALIQAHGKTKLLNDIRTVENQLFRSPKYNGFRTLILNLFSK